MKSSKSSSKFIVLSLLTVAIVVFILANSLADFKASHSLSEFVMDLLFGKTDSTAQADDHLLRKAAHIVEYALLGGAVMAVTFFCHRHYKKNLFWLAPLTSVAVAVTDECIQSFSDRNGSFWDVVLDLFGAGFGILLVWLINQIKKIKAGS